MARFYLPLNVPYGRQNVDVPICRMRLPTAFESISIRTIAHVQNDGPEALSKLPTYSLHAVLNELLGIACDPLFLDDALHGLSQGSVPCVLLPDGSFSSGASTKIPIGEFTITEAGREMLRTGRFPGLDDTMRKAFVLDPFGLGVADAEDKKFPPALENVQNLPASLFPSAFPEKEVLACLGKNKKKGDEYGMPIPVGEPEIHFRAEQVGVNVSNGVLTFEATVPLAAVLNRLVAEECLELFSFKRWNELLPDGVPVRDLGNSPSVSLSPPGRKRRTPVSVLCRGAETLAEYPSVMRLEVVVDPLVEAGFHIGENGAPDRISIAANFIPPGEAVLDFQTEFRQERVRLRFGDMPFETVLWTEDPCRPDGLKERLPAVVFALVESRLARGAAHALRLADGTDVFTAVLEKIEGMPDGAKLLADAVAQLTEKSDRATIRNIHGRLAALRKQDAQLGPSLELDPSGCARNTFGTASRNFRPRPASNGQTSRPLPGKGGSAGRLPEREPVRNGMVLVFDRQALVLSSPLFGQTGFRNCRIAIARSMTNLPDVARIVKECPAVELVDDTIPRVQRNQVNTAKNLKVLRTVSSGRGVFVSDDFPSASVVRREGFETIGTKELVTKIKNGEIQ